MRSAAGFLVNSMRICACGFASQQQVDKLQFVHQLFAPTHVVSCGAPTHHFPTKDSLLIAAVREIVARHQRDLDCIAFEKKDDRWRLKQVFGLLCDAFFQQPTVLYRDFGKVRVSQQHSLVPEEDST